jgi:RNA polymerase sigma-70 factor (ECF subfamily)
MAANRLNETPRWCIVYLVAANRGASEAAIEEVYRRRYASLLRLGYALLGSTEQARDAVQETFATALRARESFRGAGSLDGWLWRTMLNTCRQEHRRRGHVADGEPPEPATNGHPTEWPELRAAIAALPDRERHAVFLRYYAGLTQDETAEVLGVRPGTVAATLNHARAKLHAALGTEVTR